MSIEHYLGTLMTKIVQSKYETLTFNFALTLTCSYHTRRAYFRWVDAFLVATANFKPMKGQARIHRMQMLPVYTLQNVLTTQQFQSWLISLFEQGHSKQGVEQARAAIVILANLLSQSGWIDRVIAYEISEVRLPHNLSSKFARQLTSYEMKFMIESTKHTSNNLNQRLRNQLVLTMLCTLPLRHRELSNVKWGDLSIKNNKVVLQIQCEGESTRLIVIPHAIIRLLDKWREVLHDAGLQTPLIRRIWKGGRVSKYGLSPDAIWSIVDAVIEHANLDNITPDVLYRSVNS